MKTPTRLFRSIPALALALLAMTMMSCRGIQGPPGPPGARGPQGIPGQNGNANVWSINYLAIASDWYDVGTPGTPGYFLALDLDVPEIDDLILRDGLVLVYYRETETSPWIALPYTYISHDPEFIEKLDFIYDLSFVGIQSQATDMQANAYEGTFRVIVADGTPINKMEVDTQDYEAVAEWLQLADVVQQHRRVEMPDGPRQQ